MPEISKIKDISYFKNFTVDQELHTVVLPNVAAKS